MAEQQISLLPFYKGWDTYQELLIKAIEPLSLEQLSLRAAPQLRSIGDLATHIIGVRAGWLYYTLEKGDEHLVTLRESTCPFRGLTGQWIGSHLASHSGCASTTGPLPIWQKLFTIPMRMEKIKPIHASG